MEKIQQTRMSSIVFWMLAMKTAQYRSRETVPCTSRRHLEWMATHSTKLSLWHNQLLTTASMKSLKCFHLIRMSCCVDSRRQAWPIRTAFFHEHTTSIGPAADVCDVTKESLCSHYLLLTSRGCGNHRWLTTDCVSPDSSHYSFHVCVVVLLACGHGQMPLYNLVLTAVYRTGLVCNFWPSQTSWGSRQNIQKEHFTQTAPSIAWELVTFMRLWAGDS